MGETLDKIRLAVKNDMRHLFPWAYDWTPQEPIISLKLEDGEVMYIDEQGNLQIAKTLTGEPGLVGGKASPKTVAKITAKVEAAKAANPSIRVISTSGPAPVDDPAALLAYRRMKAILKEKLGIQKVTRPSRTTPYDDLYLDKEAAAWHGGYKNASEDIDLGGASSKWPPYLEYVITK